MHEHDPANPQTSSSNDGVTNTSFESGLSAPVATTRRRSSFWRQFRATLTGIYIFVIAFIAGIFFTILMQTHSLQDTPLAIIQRPILALSNIPEDAHKEWIALQQSFKYTDEYFYQHDKINHKDMIYAAAEAAINTLGDRFTVFNRPEIAKANQDLISGKFVGIGVTPEIVDGHYVIRQVLDNSPALKVGIKEGDIFIAVNGESLPDKITDYNLVGDKLRGPVGTQVKVTLQRPSDNNRQIEFEMTRAELIAPSVDARLLSNNIVYIEMTRVFGENTINEFDAKVGPLAKNNPAGYILDLRGNGGGSVETAKQLLGRFLKGGVAYYEDAPYQDIHMRPVDVLTSSQVQLYDKPLAVLVNGGSASASEITAGALHDHQRGVLIGEKTYGKGSAQLPIKLDGNTALRVTSEHWFTPVNKINPGDTKGLKPDIEVIPTDDQKKANQDVQLNRAIQYVLEKS
jgi:carboxyl-terminal processing protease